MGSGKIGALGSYSNGGSYGLPMSTLAKAYQPPYGKLVAVVPSPWAVRGDWVVPPTGKVPVQLGSRIGQPKANKSKSGKGHLGSAPMEWVMPMSVPADPPNAMNGFGPKYQMRPAQGYKRRQPTVASFGAWGKFDPMDDNQTGAQGSFLSPKWFADLFTVSPGEKAAREAKKKANQDYHRGVKDDKRNANQDLRQSRVDGNNAAKLARAKNKGKGKGYDPSGLIDTGADLISGFTGAGASSSQPVGNEIVTGPTDVEMQPAPLPGFVKPLAAVAVLGVVAAIGYKMLHKRKVRA